MPAVLVIDDDVFIRELLMLHLRKAGHSASSAADPALGIKAVLESPPDLILLDVDMPYMSGLDVLRALKADEKSRHIPVVMLTAHTDDETWMAATEAGANAYLTKPIEHDELISTVGKWLKVPGPR
jgi:two-component system phosphate regulon response regulator PhoB